MTHICHTVVPGTSVTHSVVSHTVCVSHTLLHHTLNVCVSHTSHSGAYQWVIQQWWHTSITHWSLGPVFDIDMVPGTSVWYRYVSILGPVCDRYVYPGDTHLSHTGPWDHRHISTTHWSQYRHISITHWSQDRHISITHFYHRLDLSPTDSITHWSLGPQTHIIDTLVPI